MTRDEFDSVPRDRDWLLVALVALVLTLIFVFVIAAVVG